MSNLIKKTILTGIGLAAMTKDKVEELSRELTKAGDLSEKEGKELVDELLKKSEQARKDLATQVEKLVKSTLEKLNIPTREEFVEIKKEVEKLKKQKKEK